MRSVVVLADMNVGDDGWHKAQLRHKETEVARFYQVDPDEERRQDQKDVVVTVDVNPCRSVHDVSYSSLWPYSYSSSNTTGNSIHVCGSCKAMHSLSSIYC